MSEDGSLRAVGAHHLARLAFAGGLGPRLLGDTAVVVLFHRVTRRRDDNSLTCDERRFDEFCGLFRRYFDVVPLGGLLDDLEAGRDVGGKLVITFDDGYLDNYTLARPILERHALPCCFFIATRFIDSDHVAWWDEERGERSEWMSWEQVSELAEGGFEIGAHTRHHVDLGTTPPSEAREEIEGSGRDIQERLGLEADLFSFPYGRREHITEENRALIREAGFRCCLSAFGGTVESGTSPFHVPRMPISDWYVSPYHFAFHAVRS